MNKIDKNISFLEEENDHLSYQIGLNNITTKAGVFKKLEVSNENKVISIINKNNFLGNLNDDIVLGFYNIGQNRLKINHIIGSDYKRIRLYEPNEQIRKAVETVEPYFKIEQRTGHYLFDNFNLSYLYDENIIDFYFTFKHKKIHKEILFSDPTLNNILSEGSLSLVLITDRYKISILNLKSLYFEIVYNNKILIYSTNYKKIIIDNKNFLDSALTKYDNDLTNEETSFIAQYRTYLDFNPNEDILDESYFLIN